MIISIPLNNNINYNIVKKKNFLYFIVFNNIICIKYTIANTSKINIISDLNIINININFYNDLSIFKKIVMDLNNSLNIYFFKKITFAGKGYKIKKIYKNIKYIYKNIVSFYFNKSHFNIVYFNNILLKKLKKTKLIIYTTNLKHLYYLTNIILNIRKVNIFTLKGLRLSRQIIYKKIGKKSS
jgi:hypothetical protein